MLTKKPTLHPVSSNGAHMQNDPKSRALSVARGLGCRDLMDAGNGMFFAKLIVSPSVAKRILDEHNPFNRGVLKGHVEYLVKAIKGGHWRVTHQAIAFDLDGNLLDGQHRLLACVLAEVEIECVACIYDGQIAANALDMGKPRTWVDYRKLLGGPGPEVNARIQSSLRGMLVYAYGKGTWAKASPHEMDAMLEEWSDHVRWTDQAFGKNKRRAVSRAPVVAAFTVAHSLRRFRHDVLARAIEILTNDASTVSTPGEQTVALFRAWLQTDRAADYGHRWREVIYILTTHVIVAMQDDSYFNVNDYSGGSKKSKKMLEELLERGAAFGPG